MRLPVSVRVIFATLVSACHSSIVLALDSPSASATIAAGEGAVRFAMLEARFAVSEHWSLAAAAAYLDPGVGEHEAQFRLAAIGAASFSGWSVENRHLLSFSSASVERYRMRVRVVHPTSFGMRGLSLRVFDELFFDFDRSRLFRNNAAAGIGVQLMGELNAELYHVWEMNRAQRDDAYVLALMTYRF